MRMKLAGSIRQLWLRPQLLFVGLMLVSLWGHHADAAAARLGPQPPARAEKRALLIGIDKYKNAGRNGLKNLAGCVNVQTKLSRVQSPDESWKARMLVRMAG